MTPKSIEVVGAGPAGLVAAIVLQRAGFEVIVYEERTDVGLRFHGDFQGIENWSREKDVLHQLCEMGLSVNFRCVPYHGVTIFGVNRRRVEIHSDIPLFYLVCRGPVGDSLDQGLKAQALEAGVQVIFGRRIEKIEGLAITATGPKGADAIAKGVTFNTDLPDQAVAILDDRLSPGGYCYLLVNQGRATMATVLLREYRREKECFQRMQEAFHALISFEVNNPKEFGGFGNFFLRPEEVHGRHLYVGESAGFQDFLLGFGIRYAMTSGYLAAQSIIQGTPYDRLWHEHLRPSLQASLVNRVLVDRFGHLAYRFIVQRLSRDGDVRGFLRRVYGWSSWKKLLLPYAIRHYHSRVKDERCQHSAICDCVWCRCRRD
jgi:flavin-dependent dehydrogenase